MGDGLTTGVHWLTATTPRTLQDVQHTLGRLNRAAGGGMGHPDRYVHESGASVYAGSVRADQPIVVSVPGETCEGWATEFLEWMDDLDGCVTRVDVAGDVGPADEARARLISMHSEWRAGRVITRIKRSSVHLIDSDRPGDGWTLYIGGKTAEHFCRIYDRRGLLRIEHVYRPSDKGTGKRLPQTLLKFGSGSLWRTLGRKLQFVQLQWYMDLLKGDSVDLLTAPQHTPSLPDAIEQFRHQYGLSLFAFLKMGVPVEQLCKHIKDAKLTGDQVAKFNKWAFDGDCMGYNGGALRDLLDQDTLGEL